jgi:hypothetical protein
VGILDWGTRALIDALFAMSEDADSATVGQCALIPAAMALGPLLGGGDTEAGQRLLQLGFDWSLLPAEELSRRLAGDPRRWLAT